MDANVYLGVWTNWSRGQVLGATLTVTRSSGNLVIAFTAFFISFVGSRFWRILCFISHRIYSTAQQRDVIHHQRQVILRNSSSPESGFMALVRLLHAWRKTSLKRRAALLPLALLSLLSLLAFTVAGGFSSSISSAIGDEVLLIPSRCGVTLPGDDVDQMGYGTALSAEKLNNAVNYAQQCYNTSSSGTLECGKFRSPRLETQMVNISASCPFKDGTCRSQNANLKLDTGYIDSNFHLGLNTPIDQRFALRYVRYQYGTLLGGSLENMTHYDFVYEAEDIETQYSHLQSSFKLAGANFKVNALSSYTVQGVPKPHAQFAPIQSLQRTDGDLTIVFLSGNSVLFGQVMDDEWYRATRRFGTLASYEVAGERPSFIPEEAASPLGCVEQWQWCKGIPGSDSDTSTTCGPLASKDDALTGAAHLFGLDPGFMYADRPVSNTSLGTTLIWPGLILRESVAVLNGVITYLGPKSLLSQTRLFTGIQWQLPANQWQLDVINWWSTTLALIQASFVNTALGPSDTVFDPMHWPPINEYETNMCESQTIRSRVHTSFSLFGLCFVFITGSLIVAISYGLEPVLMLLHRRFKYQQYAQLEWVSDASLQLHRMAHEENGIKTWSRCTDTVPTVEPEIFLANLDITDLEHPILSHHVALDFETKVDNTSPTSDAEHLAPNSQIGSTQDLDSEVTEHDIPGELEIAPHTPMTARTEPEGRPGPAPEETGTMLAKFGS
ncbi:hypothetical protein JX266_006405 [Neoarthrinium moseri]|uniref:uncharacterized protein n=1 Tax=Neoarthrinium moseri TaxID=1658444 RepID=UPI001FDC5911|nr:uncharacterized protein JN550_007090 [Neoarthrinium moseri]KAI1847553.1 hypothetical protein JX266_006405 [Neoarthrinium moseri]KAI1867359.1 hypothetical protein JN550_007090 [Neoarthrinium moseri]